MYFQNKHTQRNKQIKALRSCTKTTSKLAFFTSACFNSSITILSLFFIMYFVQTATFFRNAEGDYFRNLQLLGDLSQFTDSNYPFIAANNLLKFYSIPGNVKYINNILVIEFSYIKFFQYFFYFVYRTCSMFFHNLCNIEQIYESKELLIGIAMPKDIKNILQEGSFTKNKLWVTLEVITFNTKTIHSEEILKNKYMELYFKNKINEGFPAILTANREIEFDFVTVWKKGNMEIITNIFSILFCNIILGYLLNYLSFKNTYFPDLNDRIYNFFAVSSSIPLPILCLFIAQMTDNWKTTFYNGYFASIFISFLGFLPFVFCLAYNTRKKSMNKQSTKFLIRNRLLSNKKLEFHVFFKDFLEALLFTNTSIDNISGYMRGSISISQYIPSDYLFPAVKTVLSGFSGLMIMNANTEKLNSSITSLLISVVSYFVVNKCIGLIAKIVFKNAFFGTDHLSYFSHIDVENIILNRGANKQVKYINKSVIWS